MAFPSLARGSLDDALRRVATVGNLLPPSADAAAAVVAIERSAVRTADFVSTSTAPGFTYQYDPELGTFRRMETSRGPVYVETAETVGRGRFDVGISYLYSDFTELDGEPLDHALDDVRLLNGVGAVSRVRTFGLRSHILSLSTTYGITDDWDVNLLVPLFLTSLDLDVVSGVGVPGALQRLRVDESAFGPGDVQLRTKLRLGTRASVAWATFLALRLPTGDPNDFQGLGDVTMTGGLAAVRPIGVHDVHANAGFEINADDLERSRVRYAVGATLQPFARLAVLLDVTGSSGTTADHFEETFATRFGVVNVRGSAARTDVVDAVVGFKIIMTEWALLHLSAIVPLTHDGIRADVVPAGGVEVAF